MATTTERVRGIRNNNPGNIRWGDPWQGLVPFEQRTDPDFCQFTDPTWGIRAIVRILITYQDKRRAADGSVIDTVAEIIERWAPPNENDTSAYINSVCLLTGFTASEELDMHNYDHVRPLVEAIIRCECGTGPLYPNGPMNTWYSDEVIDQGLRLAGVVRKTKEIAKVPVTKETVGATAVGAVGVVQIVDALPQITHAIEDAQGHLSSGTITGIICGALSLTIAAVIAWSQVRRYRDGLI